MTTTRQKPGHLHLHILFQDLGVMHGDHRALIKRKIKEFRAAGEKDHKSKKEGKTKDRASKKAFWKGKYTVNQ